MVRFIEDSLEDTVGETELGNIHIGQSAVKVPYPNSAAASAERPVPLYMRRAGQASAQGGGGGSSLSYAGALRSQPTPPDVGTSPSPPTMGNVSPSVASAYNMVPNMNHSRLGLLQQQQLHYQQQQQQPHTGLSAMQHQPHTGLSAMQHPEQQQPHTHPDQQQPHTGLSAMQHPELAAAGVVGGGAYGQLRQRGMIRHGVLPPGSALSHLDNMRQQQQQQSGDVADPLDLLRNLNIKASPGTQALYQYFS
jgi:hypothetical protein